MTTIITTVSPSYATMVADQGITSDLTHPNMNKIVKQDTWLIGVCGTDRVCDVVQYATKYPKVPATLLTKKTDDWYKWVVTRVIPQIQRAVQDHISRDNWNLGESEILLVTHGHAFLVSETLGVTKAEPYWAVGSGSQLAIGAISERYSRPDWKAKHTDYAKESVAVAQLHDPFTRGKITGYKSYPSGKISVIV